MRTITTVLFTVHCLLLTSSWAAVEQTSSVVDGSGGLSAGGTYTNISAAGQPGGISYSTAAGLQNYAGFLGTFILRPDIVDPNGVPHELSADNDGDGLTDTGEILGTYFNPNTPTDPNNADTSGDGISDWKHSVAGTDPTGTDTFLRILTIERDAGDVTITWLSREGKNYNILYASDSHEYPVSFLTNAVGSAGAGVWQVSTNTLTSQPADDVRTFAVEVLP